MNRDGSVAGYDRAGRTKSVAVWAWTSLLRLAVFAMNTSIYDPYVMTMDTEYIDWTLALAFPHALIIFRLV